MAHANPEFALAMRAHKAPPLATQLDGPASLRELRDRMIQIGELIAIDYPVDEAERQAYRLWQRSVQHTRHHAVRARQLSEASTPAGGGMHAGDPAGVRFQAPIRRGEGRTKRWAVK